MTSSDGECGAVSCATVALVCPYVRCVCWFAAAAIVDISYDISTAKNRLGTTRSQALSACAESWCGSKFTNCLLSLRRAHMKCELI